MIKKQKVLDILHSYGGCHATDAWAQGWDDAIDAIYDQISNLEEEPTLQHIKKLESKLLLLERENKALAIEGEEKCEKLEKLNKALDKACEELRKFSNAYERRYLTSVQYWKAWALQDE